MRVTSCGAELPEACRAASQKTSDGDATTSEEQTRMSAVGYSTTEMDSKSVATGLFLQINLALI